jgi:hypothetical protein
MPPLTVLQWAVAAVWLYEGLWCKVLGRSPHEFAVIAAAPMMGPRVGPLFLRSLGVVECLLALWVISGWRPYGAALAQTSLLAALNTGGILWSRHLIPDPAGMVIKNFAFLVLAWVAAAQASAQGGLS